MNRKIINIIILCILLLGAVGIYLVYDKLPDNIPIHWNIEGGIDSYSEKEGIWYFLLTIVGINAIMLFAEKIDPKSANYKRFRKSFDIFRLIISVFFMLIILLTITVSLGYKTLDVGIIVPSSVGILITVIGNYLPKFKHNYSMGIKTPWTLASEKVWDKTHRMAAPLWVIGGIILAIIPLIFKEGLKVTFLVVVLILLVLIPTVYSFIEFKKEEKNK